jgi:hypothetical protein
MKSRLLRALICPSVASQRLLAAFMGGVIRRLASTALHTALYDTSLTMLQHLVHVVLDTRHRLSLVYLSPPESNRLCPVMYPVRHNMVTTFAHSSVLPLRPTGMFLTSPGVPFSCSSVWIIPVPVIIAGATSLNVIPLLPILLARFFERP